jgi:hypothetical protein
LSAVFDKLFPVTYWRQQIESAIGDCVEHKFNKRGLKPVVANPLTWRPGTFDDSQFNNPRDVSYLILQEMLYGGIQAHLHTRRLRNMLSDENSAKKLFGEILWSKIGCKTDEIFKRMTIDAYCYHEGVRFSCGAAGSRTSVAVKFQLDNGSEMKLQMYGNHEVNARGGTPGMCD